STAAHRAAHGAAQSTPLDRIQLSTSVIGSRVWRSHRYSENIWPANWPQSPSRIAARRAGSGIESRRPGKRLVQVRVVGGFGWGEPAGQAVVVGDDLAAMRGRVDVVDADLAVRRAARVRRRPDAEHPDA